MAVGWGVVACWEEEARMVYRTADRGAVQKVVQAAGRKAVRCRQTLRREGEVGRQIRLHRQGVEGPPRHYRVVVAV